MQTISESFVPGAMPFRPLLLNEVIRDVATTRDAIKQADRARDDVHEIRNLLEAEQEAYREFLAENEGMPVPMQDWELAKAQEACHKAAGEASAKLAILHRNLMTLLGYRTLQEVQTEALPV